MAELNEVKNYIMQMTYFLNGPMFNPIQDRGGGQKDPPTSFSSLTSTNVGAFPVTSTNVGISPKNILTFSFNPFATLM